MFFSFLSDAAMLPLVLYRRTARTYVYLGIDSVIYFSFYRRELVDLAGIFLAMPPIPCSLAVKYFMVRPRGGRVLVRSCPSRIVSSLLGAA